MIFVAIFELFLEQDHLLSAHTHTLAYVPSADKRSTRLVTAYCQLSGSGQFYIKLALSGENSSFFILPREQYTHFIGYLLENEENVIIRSFIHKRTVVARTIEEIPLYNLK
jgi:hypothetical protein